MKLKKILHLWLNMPAKITFSLCILQLLFHGSSIFIKIPSTISICFSFSIIITLFPGIIYKLIVFLKITYYKFRLINMNLDNITTQPCEVINTTTGRIPHYNLGELQIQMLQRYYKKRKKFKCNSCLIKTACSQICVEITNKYGLQLMVCESVLRHCKLIPKEDLTFTIVKPKRKMYFYLW